MVTLKREFDAFHSRVRLDDTRREVVKNRVDTLRATLTKDDSFERFLTGEVFLQGSYAQHTIVRPLPPRGEFDVDVVVVAKGDPAQSSGALRRQFVALLREYPNYKPIIDDDQARCIRLAYRGNDAEFHLDIVLAVQSSDPITPYGIADFPSNSWRPSNPKELIEWVEEKNKDHGGRFTKAMKILKRWRDITPELAGDLAPKSLPLTAFAGKHLPTASRRLRGAGREHHTLYSLRDDGLDAFFTDLVMIMADCLMHKAGKPRIENPRNPNEDLAARWSPQAFEAFNRALRTLATGAERAYKAERVEDSIRTWTRLLGEQFPQG